MTLHNCLLPNFLTPCACMPVVVHRMSACNRNFKVPCALPSDILENAPRLTPQHTAVVRHKDGGSITGPPMCYPSHIPNPCCVCVCARPVLSPRAGGFYSPGRSWATLGCHHQGRPIHGNGTAACLCSTPSAESEPQQGAKVK